MNHVSLALRAGAFIASRALALPSSDRFARLYASKGLALALSETERASERDLASDNLASLARVARFVCWHIEKVSEIEWRESVSRSPSALGALAYHVSEARSWGEALNSALARLSA